VLELFGVQLGTVFQGGTLAAMVAVLGFLLRYRLGLRKLQIGDEANVRDHYSLEVKRYTEKLAAQEVHFRELEDHLREMLAKSDRRHDECEQLRAFQWA